MKTAVFCSILLLTCAAPPRLFAQPTITQQPTDQSVSLGAKVTFQVMADDIAPLSYQWRFKALPIFSATNQTLALTNALLTSAGNYAVVVTDSSGSVTSRVASLEVDPTFTKITTGHIVNDGAHSVGCAWGDYDNDGLMDLFVANADGQSNLLYRNNGDGTFTRITSGSIVNDGGDWRGCSWGDYDNDGHLDLFVTATDNDGFVAQNILYRNNGDGTFTTVISNMGSIIRGSEACAWGDYDNDGLLDMFVASYGNDHLYHAVGDGTFSLIDSGPLVTDNLDSYQASWADYNNDGRLDLFVSMINNQNNRLYRNAGDGVFIQTTTDEVGSIVGDGGDSRACNWGDYDNDGYLDLFISNQSSQNNFLYHNNGNGSFTRVTTGSLVSDGGNSTGNAWGDYDNDGYLDLFVANRNGEKNFLYHNNGNGTFTRITNGSLANDSGTSIGCAWADYDNDGFLDLFVANGAHESQDNYLYRNNGNRNHWLKIKCVGTVSNRSAIGAKVRVKATINSTDRWQMRQITTGTGFCGKSLIEHFGLGDTTNVDTVRIEWPSGTVQELHDVAANQTLTVTEPPRLSAPGITNGMFAFTLKGGRGFQYAVQTSTNAHDWTVAGSVTVTNLNGTARFAEQADISALVRLYRARLETP